MIRPIEKTNDTMRKLSISEKITHITEYIAKSHPELYKFIEEMPITIPKEKKPNITQLQLESYFESLSLLIKKIEIKNSTFYLFPDEIHT